MEPGETTAEALVRELKEELDLTVDPAECRYFTRSISIWVSPA